MSLFRRNKNVNTDHGILAKYERKATLDSIRTEKYFWS